MHEEPDATAVAWEQVAGSLSTAAMRARSLRRRHQDDQRLRVELDALIIELDGAFGTVMRTAAPLPDVERPERAAGEEPPPRSPAGRFCQWVRASCPGDVGGPGDDASDWRDPASLLSHLAADPAAVPGDVAAILGLWSGAAYGDAVERLRWARRSPDGPRCRSYRSACLFLRSADRGQLPRP